MAKRTLQVDVRNSTGTVLWSKKYDNCQLVSDAIEQAMDDVPEVEPDELEF